jgi:hypothetical protein
MASRFNAGVFQQNPSIAVTHMLVAACSMTRLLRCLHPDRANRPIWYYAQLADAFQITPRSPWPET